MCSLNFEFWEGNIAWKITEKALAAYVLIWSIQPVISNYSTNLLPLVIKVRPLDVVNFVKNNVHIVTLFLLAFLKLHISDGLLKKCTISETAFWRFQFRLRHILRIWLISDCLYFNVLIVLSNFNFRILTVVQNNSRAW